MIIYVRKFECLSYDHLFEQLSIIVQFKKKTISIIEYNKKY